jgi:hypothetical protein
MLKAASPLRVGCPKTSVFGPMKNSTGSPNSINDLAAQKGFLGSGGRGKKTHRKT